MRKIFALFLTAFFASAVLVSVAFAYGDGMPRGASLKLSKDYEEDAVIPNVPMPSSEAAQGYVLGIGDRIKLTVYGEEDLSGEYDVSSTGVVSMPLIGDVHAASKTILEFEKAVKNELSKGYLRDPRVSVQVTNYRPFFILGEVSKPGSYPYVNGMTVLNAVALAGGYTYRADAKSAVVVHAGDPDKKEIPINEEDKVLPGDIIRVPERFF